MVRMELYRLMIRENEDGQVIVLREMEGSRTFPIFIGTIEATVIDRYLRDIQLPRPLTHDLLSTVIEQLGGSLQRVVVNDLKDRTFYAQLHIATDDGMVTVDARPSDAIALAMATGADIFAEESVIESAGTSTDEIA